MEPKSRLHDSKLHEILTLIALSDNTAHLLSEFDDSLNVFFSSSSSPSSPSSPPLPSSPNAASKSANLSEKKRSAEERKNSLDSASSSAVSSASSDQKVQVIVIGNGNHDERHARDTSLTATDVVFREGDDASESGESPVGSSREGDWDGTDSMRSFAFEVDPEAVFPFPSLMDVAEQRDETGLAQKTSKGQGHLQETFAFAFRTYEDELVLYNEEQMAQLAISVSIQLKDAAARNVSAILIDRFASRVSCTWTLNHRFRTVYDQVRATLPLDLGEAKLLDEEPRSGSADNAVFAEWRIAGKAADYDADYEADVPPKDARVSGLYFHRPLCGEHEKTVHVEDSFAAAAASAPPPDATRRLVYSILSEIQKLKSMRSTFDEHKLLALVGDLFDAEEIDAQGCVSLLRAVCPDFADHFQRRSSLMTGHDTIARPPVKGYAKSAVQSDLHGHHVKSQSFSSIHRHPAVVASPGAASAWASPLPLMPGPGHHGSKSHQLGHHHSLRRPTEHESLLLALDDLGSLDRHSCQAVVDQVSAWMSARDRLPTGMSADFMRSLSILSIALKRGPGVSAHELVHSLVSSFPALYTNVRNVTLLILMSRLFGLRWYAALTFCFLANIREIWTYPADGTCKKKQAVTSLHTFKLTRSSFDDCCFLLQASLP
eukprot:ANDGO_04545.mRNA.1 hypothetical protein